MPDDQSASRRPLGERDDNERKLPFGARPPAGPDAGRSSPVDHDRSPAPDEPYFRPSPPPPREPDPSPIDLDEVEPEFFELPFKSQPRPTSDSDNGHPIGDELDALSDDETSPPSDPFAFDDDPYDDEPHVSDEPDDAPSLIAVRSQRRKKLSDTGILKARAVQEALEAQKRAEAEAVAASKPQRPPTVLGIGVILQSIAMIFLTAAVFATLFTWWTPNTFLPTDSIDRLSVALATQTAPSVNFVPTLTPLPGTANPVVVAPPAETIGIISGHKGTNPNTGQPDPSVTCADGITEQATVENIVNLTASVLRAQNYQVEIFDEWDARLNGYAPAVLLALHADSCDEASTSGFKIASHQNSANPDADSRLVGCMIGRYSETTGLLFQPSVLSWDGEMPNYHAFREVQSGTPAVMMAVGSMSLDREIITQRADVVASGIAQGLVCFLKNEPIDLQEDSADSAPTAEP